MPCTPGDSMLCPKLEMYNFSYLEKYLMTSSSSKCLFMVEFGNKVFLLKELKDHVEIEF